MTRHRTAVIATTGLALACAAGATLPVGGGGGGEGGRGSGSLGGLATRRAERVLVPAFHTITHIAVTSRLTFIATDGALGIYDHQFRNWLPPLTEADGLPSTPVSAIAADPVEDAVWLGVNGALYYFVPRSDHLTRSTLAGSVDAIVFDTRDYETGAYARAGSSWYRVTRTGFATRVSPAALPPAASRSQTPALRDLYQEFPSLEAFEGLLTRNDRSRPWPVISGSKSPDRSEVWLGTRGNGMFRADPVFNQSEHLPFGLLGRAADALALAADGIWIAGGGMGVFSRGGLTFASTDLQGWRWLDGPTTRPFAGARINALAVRGTVAWLATSRGVMRMTTRNGDDFWLWTSGNGLPSDEVLSVAATSDGAWVGTANGAVFIADSAAGRRGGRGSVSEPIVRNTAVRSLLAGGDTLWIGSDAGLLLVSPASSDVTPRRPAAAAREPRLTRPIVALARSGAVVAAATRDGVMRFDLATGELMPRLDAVNFRTLQGITSLAMDEETLWAVGSGGAIVLDLATGVARYLAVPAEIPAEVNDVRLQHEYAWLATGAGLLRLRRLPDGTIP